MSVCRLYAVNIAPPTSKTMKAIIIAGVVPPSRLGRLEGRGTSIAVETSTIAAPGELSPNSAKQAFNDAGVTTRVVRDRATDFATSDPTQRLRGTSSCVHTCHLRTMERSGS